MDGIVSVLISVLLVAASAVVGFWAGYAKLFKEHQLTMYCDILPTLLKYAFSNPTGDDRKDEEAQFNAAINTIWLYGSRKVALQLEIALHRLARRGRGDPVPELKKTIIAIRNDIWPRWRFCKRKLTEEELQHFQFGRKRQAS